MPSGEHEVLGPIRACVCQRLARLAKVRLLKTQSRAFYNDAIHVTQVNPQCNGFENAAHQKCLKMHRHAKKCIRMHENAFGKKLHNFSGKNSTTPACTDWRPLSNRRVHASNQILHVDQVFTSTAPHGSYHTIQPGETRHVTRGGLPIPRGSRIGCPMEAKASTRGAVIEPAVVGGVVRGNKVKDELMLIKRANCM